MADEAQHGDPVDEGLRRIAAASTEEEVLAVEADLIEQTDNRPHDGDPVQPEEEAG